MNFVLEDKMFQYFHNFMLSKFGFVGYLQMVKHGSNIGSGGGKKSRAAYKTSRIVA